MDKYLITPSGRRNLQEDLQEEIYKKSNSGELPDFTVEITDKGTVIIKVQSFQIKKELNNKELLTTEQQKNNSKRIGTIISRALNNFYKGIKV